MGTSWVSHLASYLTPNLAGPLSQPIGQRPKSLVLIVKLNFCKSCDNFETSNLEFCLSTQNRKFCDRGLASILAHPCLEEIKTSGFDPKIEP